MEKKIDQRVFKMWHMFAYSQLQHLALVGGLLFIIPVATFYVVQVFAPQEKLPQQKQLKQLNKKLNEIDRKMRNLNTEKIALVGERQNVELRVTAQGQVFSGDAMMEEQESEGKKRLKAIKKEIRELRTRRIEIDKDKQTISEGMEEKMKAVRKRYDANFFYIVCGLGLLAIIIGAFIVVPSLGFGFIGGGVVSLLQGYMHYWGRMSNTIKLVSLVGVMVLLVLIGNFMFKKMKD